MKNYQKALLLMLLAVCIIIGCKSCNDPVHNEEYKEVKVNASFIKNPPLAQNIQVSLYNETSKAGNVLFEATLPQEKIKSRTHAIMITEKDKIVLHDDGKNGDKKADDGVYSIVLAENLDHLKTWLEAREDSLAKLVRAKIPLHHFKSRTMVSDCTMISPKVEFDFRKGISLIPLITPVPASPVTDLLKRNSLMVTDVAVVNDSARTYNPCDSTGTPGGAWTFGHLISEMANTPLTGVTPEDFLLNWLNTWLTDQSVNGDVIAARPRINDIINEWRILSGTTLNVNKAPFKLLAIVNRFDLKETTGYGGGNAGEGRFVFCATNRACVNLSFLVIFEYGVNKTTCSDIHAYAQQWRDLEFIKLTSGIEAYNTALQDITDQFVLAGTSPSKPNQSSLNQIRTNELALGVFPWELREFNIDNTTMHLKNVTTKREPQIPYNRLGTAPDAAKIQAFGEFVNVKEGEAIADQLDIPDSLDIAGVLTPFLGAKAHTLDAFTFHWDASPPPGTGFITSFEARHHISLNTCSGCHGGEVNTGNFTHVGLPGGPAFPEANLSQFLTGSPPPPPYSDLEFPVTDRANRPVAPPDPPPYPHVWGFNDLQRRGEFLVDFLTTDCPSVFPFPPVSITGFTIKLPVTIALTKILTVPPLTMTH